MLHETQFDEKAHCNHLKKSANSINFSNKICPDQIVLKIVVNNCVLQLQQSKILIRSIINAKSFDVDYSKKYTNNYLIFILESPHIDEFDSKTKKPIGPACGKKGQAGCNIEHYLNTVFKNSPLFASSLKNNSTYELLLMNAVQYQASLGISPIDKQKRDDNWLDFWNRGFDKDLVNRIKHIRKYAQDVKVVNLCTIGLSGLHFYVNSMLMANNIPFFEGYHPSYNWSLPGRQKIW